MPFTVHADFNLIDGTTSTSAKHVWIAASTQIMGPSGVIFDDGKVDLTGGVLTVSLPSPDDAGVEPDDFGFVFTRESGRTRRWQVPAQPNGTTVELTAFTSTSSLPLTLTVAEAAQEAAAASASDAAISATASAASATAAAGSASAAAATAAAIPATNDPIVEGLIEDDDSATRVALSAAFGSATAGKADAVGPFADLLHAAQFGETFTYAACTDSVGDETDEWPRRTLDLLAAQYPDVRMELKQFSDGSQTYGASTVVTAGAAPRGGTIADDTLTGTGNAVGAAADTTGTWIGSGTVTKGAAAGYAVPSANGVLSVNCPLQDSKVTDTLKVTTAGWPGGSQAHKVMCASTNAGLSGYGCMGILTITGASTTILTMRKNTLTGGLVTVSSETLDLGLNSVTDQAATIVAELDAGTFTVTITVGATVTVRSFTLTAPELAEMGAYAGAGANPGGGVGAQISMDRLKVETDVIPTPVITCYNGSVAGKNPDYVPSRVAALFPVDMDAVVLSYGHNSGKSPADFLTEFDATVDAVEADQPRARIYVASQNPQYPPMDAARHNLRQAVLRSYAASAGLAYIPVFEGWEAQTDNGEGLTDADGIHPGTGGSTLTARIVTDIPEEEAPAVAGIVMLDELATPLRAGDWYPIGPTMQHLNAAPPLSNEQAVAFVAGRTTTLTGIAVEVQTAGGAGAVLRAGVRADNDNRPGTLLADLGTVSATSTGVKTWTPSVALVAGTRYWITITPQVATSTLVCLYNLSAPRYGAASAANALANTNYGWRVSGQTGALGASFTADNMAGAAPKMVISAAT